MLTFVGLGLYDERSVTIAGREAIQRADRVFLEWYTSRLVDATAGDLEAFHDVSIAVQRRDDIEQTPDHILDAAADGDVVLATAGDPMVATTHVDLRLRAHDRGIATRLVHGPTAAAAAAGLTGLQHYRFGQATTIPFADSHGGEGIPPSVLETIEDNGDRGLHTLAFLDIKVDEDRYLTGSQAAARMAKTHPDRLAVVVARAGGADPTVRADRLGTLADGEYGGPLHLLVLPGELHHMERRALATFAGAPTDVLPDA